MKFRTEIEIKSLENKIKAGDPILLIGSCFSENIGKRLKKLKFPSSINPYGTLFQPLAINDCLLDIINEKKFKQEDFFQNHEIWSSFQLHSSKSVIELGPGIEEINESIQKTNEFLRNCQYLILTFGSAFAYEHLNSGSKVANCHKISSKEFKKVLLSTEEIVAAFSETLKIISKFNPKIKIILTVSPVKHLKDGLIENNLSKATCILAAHQLVKKFSNIHYFPAYELMNEDLRDYRFYQSDLAHPNEQAIDYIFEKFYNWIFSEESIELKEKLEEIHRMMNHIPFHTKTISYLDFLMAGKSKINSLKHQFPTINLEEEYNYFFEKIKAETK